MDFLMMLGQMRAPALEAQSRRWRFFSTAPINRECAYVWNGEPSFRQSFFGDIASRRKQILTATLGPSRLLPRCRYHQEGQAALLLDRSSRLGPDFTSTITIHRAGAHA